jgi:acetyltransferase-like isoleucine patch superfamily enzyme
MWRALRLGPDVPLTHLLLHSKPMGRWLCRQKFHHFGEGAEFRPYAYAIRTDRIHIGARVVVRPGTMLFASETLGGDIVIEDDVLIGSGVHIYCDNHSFEDVSRPIIDQGDAPTRPVRICRGAWLGANAILLPGVTVGENAVVGAGAVVTRDVPPRRVAAGNPARVIRAIDADGNDKANHADL